MVGLTGGTTLGDGNARGMHRQAQRIGWDVPQDPKTGNIAQGHIHRRPSCRIKTNPCDGLCNRGDGSELGIGGQIRSHGSRKRILSSVPPRPEGLGAHSVPGDTLEPQLDGQGMKTLPPANMGLLLLALRAMHYKGKQKHVMASETRKSFQVW